MISNTLLTQFPKKMCRKKKLWKSNVSVEIKAKELFYQGQSKSNFCVVYAVSNHLSRKVNKGNIVGNAFLPYNR